MVACGELDSVPAQPIETAWLEERYATQSSDEVHSLDADDVQNYDFQEKAPGTAPENLASPVATTAELTPENMELLANYSWLGGRADKGGGYARPVVTSGRTCRC